MGEMTWRGNECMALVLKALRRGIDKTSSDATITAKRLVHRKTGTLQGSIAPEPAKVVGNEVAGSFATHDVNYAFWQEFLPPERGGKPYMRPAAEEAKRNLAGNIKSAWESIQ